MPRLLLLSCLAWIIILCLDAVWLTLTVPRFYLPHLQYLWQDAPFQYLTALAFYALHAFALVYLILYPGWALGYSVWEISMRGALFGCVVYAAYDLTNQATIPHWPIIVTVVDIVWGSVLTGTAAMLTCLLSKLRVFAG